MTCKCNWCTVEKPLVNEIESHLPPELKQKFTKLIEDKWYKEEELAVQNSKLTGVWPNWEWIVDEIKKRNLIV